MRFRIIAAEWLGAKERLHKQHYAWVENAGYPAFIFWQKRSERSRLFSRPGLSFGLICNQLWRLGGGKGKERSFPYRYFCLLDIDRLTCTEKGCRIFGNLFRSSLNVLVKIARLQIRGFELLPDWIQRSEYIHSIYQ